MRFIHNMLKMTSRRICQTTATSLFFIIGMTFSMLIVSVGISFVAENLKGQQEKENAMPPNGEQFNLYRDMEQGECFEYKKIPQLLKGLAPDSGVIFNDLMIHLDEMEANTVDPVSAEWFSEGAEWHYPIAEGRYYTADEVQKGAKVVLLGGSLEKYTQVQDGKRYVAIEGERYEVIGRVGLSDQMSLWDNRIFMPVTALPESQKRKYDTTSEMDFILYNVSGRVEEESSKILENAEQLYPGVGIDSLGTLEIDDVVKNMKNKQDPIFLTAFLGYTVSLIYAVNIVVFWLEKRRYEIGVRKAFGYTNRAIAILIFAEMLGLSLLAFVFSLVIQGVVSIIVGRISGYIFKLYASNILLGLLFVLLATFIISIWPVVRALKIQPAEALKGRGGTNA